MILAILLLVVPLLEVAAGSSKFKTFKIRGMLTCRGDPIKGNIIMVDDNCEFLIIIMRLK